MGGGISGAGAYIRWFTEVNLILHRICLVMRAILINLHLI
jgi:hypothetical protein